MPKGHLLDHKGGLRVALSYLRTARLFADETSDDRRHAWHGEDRWHHCA
jgi:hypothetical protein